MRMELSQDLRYTSDEMLRMLERLRTLEMSKRKMEPGTDRFRKLAGEIEELAAKVLAHTHDQEELAVESVELASRNLLDPVPIDEMPPVRELHIILADWREAERRQSLAAPGSVEASDAQAEAQRLRQEYRHAAQAAPGGKQA